MIFKGIKSQKKTDAHVWEARLLILINERNEGLQSKTKINTQLTKA
jgi:hypothetical protein